MWFLWIIGAVGIFLVVGGNTTPLAFIFAATPFVWFGGRALIGHTKKAVSQSLAEKRDEKEWRKNLYRRAEEERVLGSARNEAVIQLMREQAENLIRQQNAGLHVEKELMAMREKMLTYENTEFEDLIGKINKHL
jgi:hypothetical protein